MSYNITLLIGQIHPNQTVLRRLNKETKADVPVVWFQHFGSCELRAAHVQYAADFARNCAETHDVFVYSPIVTNPEHMDEMAHGDRYNDQLTAIPINHVIDHFGKMLERIRAKHGIAADDKNWNDEQRTYKLHWLLKNFRSYWHDLELYVVPYGS